MRSPALDPSRERRLVVGFVSAALLNPEDVGARCWNLRQALAVEPYKEILP